MNIPTLIVLLVLLLVVGAVVFSLVKKKKNGGGSCSCGCSGCSIICSFYKLTRGCLYKGTLFIQNIFLDSIKAFIIRKGGITYENKNKEL